MENQNISYTTMVFFTKDLEYYTKCIEEDPDKDNNLINMNDRFRLSKLKKESDSKINFKNLSELKKYFEEDKLFVNLNLSQIYILKEGCFILVKDIDKKNSNFSDIKNIIDEINNDLESETFITYVNSKPLLEFIYHTHYKSQDANLNNKFVVIDEETDFQIAENSLAELIESYQKEMELLAKKYDFPF